MKPLTAVPTVLLGIVSLTLAVASTSLNAQATPDWSGVWIAEGLAAEISGFPSPGARFYRLAGVEAPWNEEGRRRMDAVLANQGDRKADGWGFPMMMDSAAPLQFLVTPQETLIVNMYRDLRHVYTDGRDHPPPDDRWPTTWGDSVGRWEGDTLVIDTVSVREPTAFFFFSPPLSEQARYVERLRMVAPDRIEGSITIEDPLYLAGPWQAQLGYVRAAGLDRLIHDAYANDRSELDGGVFTITMPDD